MFWTSAKQTSANVIRTGGMRVFISGEFRENLARSSSQFAASTNRRFEFCDRSQLFIGAHNEALTVAAMCVIRFGNMAVKDFFPASVKAPAHCEIDFRRSDNKLTMHSTPPMWRNGRRNGLKMRCYAREVPLH